MFDYPPKRKNLAARLKHTDYEMRQERRKPVLPGPYVYVGDFETNDPPVVTWQSPVWQNNFTWYGDAYVGFRHGLDGWTEFIGKIDLTQGAVTGTVAFTLPVPWRSLTFDFNFPIFVEGTTWWTGVLSIDKSNGEVTAYWPIEATAI